MQKLWSYLVDYVPGFRKWFGEGTPDDIRNFGWRIIEALRVKVEWAKYLIDLRLGFRAKANAKWSCYLAIWTPVTQNFWNGILTLNVYVVKTKIKGIPMILPRVGLVIRFCHDWYFQFGVGILFDRGEFGLKLRITKTEPGDAIGFEEGSV